MVRVMPQLRTGGRKRQNARNARLAFSKNIRCHRIFCLILTDRGRGSRSGYAYLLGIDPVVVMKDIAKASREQALDALEWTAKTLAEAALKGQASTPTPGSVSGG